jgi:DeoR/GlpR family transcriptional regulator of sugar metabolism
LLDALTEVLAKTSEKILVLIQDRPLITIAELAKTIGVTERSIERNLKKLQAEQRLSRTGPAKGGCWVVVTDDL